MKADAIRNDLIGMAAVSVGNGVAQKSGSNDLKAYAHHFEIPDQYEVIGIVLGGGTSFKLDLLCVKKDSPDQLLRITTNVEDELTSNAWFVQYFEIVVTQPHHKDLLDSLEVSEELNLTEFLESIV